MAFRAKRPTPRVSVAKRGPFPYEVAATLAAYGPPVRPVTLADYVAARQPVTCRYATARAGGYLINPGETVTVAQWRDRQRRALADTYAVLRAELGLPNIAA